jgi:hypothetical protein
MVGQNLREREGSLDSKTDGAQEANIGLGTGKRGEVEDGHDGDEIGKEEPVSVEIAGQRVLTRQIEKGASKLTAWCSSTARNHRAG